MLTIPVVVKPVVILVQFAIVPTQVTDIQVAVRRVPKMYDVSPIPPLIDSQMNYLQDVSNSVS